MGRRVREKQTGATAPVVPQDPLGMSDIEPAASNSEPIRTDEDGATIYKLAMDEGLSRLSHQDAEVGISRTRIMQLMTVVTAATTFLAAAAFAASRGDRHAV